MVFVQRYKYMHIYLWTTLRIVVFERGIYGFWKRTLWFLKEGFEVEIFLFLATGFAEFGWYCVCRIAYCRTQRTRRENQNLKIKKQNDKSKFKIKG